MPIVASGYDSYGNGVSRRTRVVPKYCWIAHQFRLCKVPAKMPHKRDSQALGDTDSHLVALSSNCQAQTVRLKLSGSNCQAQMWCETNKTTVRPTTCFAQLSAFVPCLRLAPCEYRVALVIFGLIFTVPTALVQPRPIVVHIVFAAFGWTQPVIGVIGIIILRNKQLNLLRALGFHSDVDVEREVERIAQTQMTITPIKGINSSMIHAMHQGRNLAQLSHTEWATYRLHTKGDQTLLASSCLYLALFCVWFCQNISDVTDSSPLKALWVLFITTPAFLVMFVIHPRSLAMHVFLSANLFPEKFHMELGKVIDRQAETKEQLQAILNIFRDELDQNGHCHSVQDLDAVFKVFDKNNLGYCSTEDFHSLLQTEHLYSFLGASGEKQIQRLVRLFDPTHSGRFEYHRFASQVYRATGVRCSTQLEPTAEEEVEQVGRGEMISVGGRFDVDLGLFSPRRFHPTTPPPSATGGVTGNTEGEVASKDDVLARILSSDSMDSLATLRTSDGTPVISPVDASKLPPLTDAVLAGKLEDGSDGVASLEHECNNFEIQIQEEEEVTAEQV